MVYVWGLAYSKVCCLRNPEIEIRSPLLHSIPQWILEIDRPLTQAPISTRASPVVGVFGWSGITFCCCWGLGAEHLILLLLHFICHRMLPPHVHPVRASKPQVHVVLLDQRGINHPAAQRHRGTAHRHRALRPPPTPPAPAARFGGCPDFPAENGNRDRPVHRFLTVI